MKQTFYKYEGTGNDFILMDNREMKFPAEDVQLCKHLCDRHFGIGADGLILLQAKKGFDFEMIYFNADGNKSSLCGNGGRCIVHFANELGIIKKKEVKFMAIDGIHKAMLGKNNMVKLKMSQKDMKFCKYPQKHFIINTGSPHYVVKVEDVMNIDVVKEGRRVRYSEKYAKEGINVNFVQIDTPEKIIVRTYERGVENETLSCGTGTVAAALYLKSCSRGVSENYCDVITMGGKLRVWFKENKTHDEFTNIWLEGPVKMVYKGEIEI